MSLGDILGTGVQFVGDLLNMDQQRSLTHQSLDVQESEAEKNRQMQEEFAKNGIQWKVQDAVSAGLSPLYALSGGASYSPGALPVMQLPDMTIGKAVANMGQNISRAARAQLAEDQRTSVDLGNKLIQSEIEEHDMRSKLLEAQRFKLLQEPVPQRMPTTLLGGAGGAEAFPVPDVVRPEGHELDVGNVGAVKLQASPVVSASGRNLSSVAGVQPSMMTARLPGGLPMQIPYDNNGVGQAWSNMSAVEKLSVISYNSRYYGKGWLPSLLSQWYGSGKYYDSWGDMISDALRIPALDPGDANTRAKAYKFYFGRR